jgi:putative N6-adenine-specific DNA methylase
MAGRDDRRAGMAGRDDRRAGMAGRDDRRAGMAGRDDRRAGWIVTNPPYGRRVRGGDLRDLFASIGRSVRDELPGWHVGMLIADRTAAGHARLTFEDRFVTSNGGIPVTFAVAVTG